MTFNVLDKIIANRLKNKFDGEISEYYSQLRFDGIEIPTIVMRLWKLEKKAKWSDFHVEINTPSTEILLGLQSARQSSKVSRDIKALAKLMFTALNDLKKSKTLDVLLDRYDILELDINFKDGN